MYMDWAKLDPDRIQWQASGFLVLKLRDQFEALFISELCTVQTVAAGPTGNSSGVKNERDINYMKYIHVNKMTYNAEASFQINMFR
jgi:hypothetical protein